MMRFLKNGFTLMEVNLAVFIMAVGVLGMVALYPLAFRENQQSQDDVTSAALADAVLNPLVAALSATNITWSAWRQAIPASGDRSGLPTADGWKNYCNDRWQPKNRSAFKSQSTAVINKLCNLSQSVVSGTRAPRDPSSDISAAINNYAAGLAVALVATYGTYYEYNINGGNVVKTPRLDKSRIVLSLRAARRSAGLFAQPIFMTEVHFQGDPNK